MTKLSVLVNYFLSTFQVVKQIASREHLPFDKDKATVAMGHLDGFSTKQMCRCASYLQRGRTSALCLVR